MASDVESRSRASSIPGNGPLPIPKRRRPAWWVYVGLVLAILVLGIGGFYSVWYFSAKAELDDEIAESRRRGEPVWFSELEPPPVPADENGALLAVWANPMAFVRYGAAFDDAATRAREAARKGDGIGRLKVDEPALQAGLDAVAQQLAASREAIAKPHFQWRYDYQTKFPIGILIPHVQNARAVARLLSGEFLLALDEGDVENALRAIEEQYALAELFRQEPTLVSHLVRIAIASMATDNLEILLGRAELTDDQFSRIDRRLKEIEASFRLREVILAERAGLLTTMENMSEADGLGMEGTRGMSMLPPLVMRDQAFAMRYMRESAEAVDRTGPAGQAERKQLDDDLRAQVKKYPLASMLIPASSAAANAGLRHRQSLVNARLGLRVDRYWRKNGRLPGNLSDVLDDDMKELPKCLFSDLPPILKPDGAAGFLLYTPCQNGVDDSADRSLDPWEGGLAFKVIYRPAAQSESK
ncbi:MAG: hypothetical protein HYS13_06060 [Planctomycetia bacterium]|nr:hypothetical protein [Planctomycetia bacterium]